jgi:hypothetical protein
MSGYYSGKCEFSVTPNLWCIVSRFVLEFAGTPEPIYRTQSVSYGGLSLILGEFSILHYLLR